jgi:hypothetical protein
MKLTKKELNILIEKYLSESNGKEDINKEATDALAKVGISMYVINTLASFLKINPESVRTIVFNIIDCGLEKETEAVIIDNIIWFSENVEAFNIFAGVEGGLTGYEGISAALAMGASGLAAMGFMIALPAIVLQEIQDSKKIENQLEKQLEMKENTRFRTGKPLGIDDINKTGYQKLLALMIKDKKEGNDTLDRLFDNKIIDNEVVDKVINQYNDYTGEDYTLKVNLEFDNEIFEKIFLVLKYVLVIFPFFQECLEAGEIVDTDSFLEFIENNMRTVNKRKNEIKALTLKVLQHTQKT